MTNPISLIGAGGHAKVALSSLQASGRNAVAIYDDNQAVWGEELLGVRIDGPIAQVPRDLPAVIAIGDNTRRKALAESLSLEWATIVDPKAFVHPSVHLGPGTVVFAGAIVQPDVRLGAHAIVNTGATVDHDCLIGDFVHIGPGCNLSGAVRLGEGVLMGVGACAKPCVQVGAWATIGAGAAVVSTIPRGQTAVGTPAKPRSK